MEEEEAPLLFLCPISMELMSNPVTISTGVTYERKNIEKWFFTYKKKTCPATMQILHTFDIIPNNTLKSLISSWHNKPSYLSPPPSPLSSIDHDKLISLLTTIKSTPFKVTYLRKLQSEMEENSMMVHDFVSLGGVDILAKVISQLSNELQGSDFSAFRACEESLAILHQIHLSDKSTELLSKPKCMNSMITVLQRGSAEARLNTIKILQRISFVSKEWMVVDQENGMDVIRSLLELLSDEVSTKLSSCSLDVLIEIVSASKKNIHKAVEAGAVCVLIELLPDSNRHTCEKILMLLKRLCECPDGRLAFTDHGLGVAAVSKKMMRVSDLVTKLGMKILWVVCSFSPKEKMIDDMMVYGTVRKLIGILHIDGRSSVKETAVKLLKLHGGVWRKYSCFPCEFKEYLKLLDH